MPSRPTSPHGQGVRSGRRQPGALRAVEGGRGRSGGGGVEGGGAEGEREWGICVGEIEGRNGGTWEELRGKEWRGVAAQKKTLSAQYLVHVSLERSR